MSHAGAGYGQAIAVIGMSGRFPGAPTLQEYWQVIEQGRDTITRGERLHPANPMGESASDAAPYIAARGVLADVESFDPGFFDFTPAEAAQLDPQQRLWLELAYHALESAGYAHDHHDQIISVFAGSFISSYLYGNLLPTRRALEEFLRMQHVQSLALLVHNDPTFLPSRTAYKLGLHGPAVNVQTACSTSLVAIAMGVQSLLSLESDIAIAGGVCLALPQNCGYYCREGAIMSRDGTCRPYDGSASGTVSGNGGGAVVLKRLDEAERDRDPILAVLRGAAINNDGHSKVSYFAPSPKGQAEVITTALGLAEVNAETIGYVEGHGTGTRMGDPIEVEALTKAFRRQTSKTGFCCLGSAKGNIGHLDAAAGVAGFIRAVLALRHRVLPPTAHFSSPNPGIDFGRSPFFVLPQARPWEAAGHPRRAGVSSFGIGGTNAHVILEEYAPPSGASSAHDAPVELHLSAKDPGALDEATRALASYLSNTPNAPLARIAQTLSSRRRNYPHRRSVLVDRGAEAAVALADPSRWDTGTALSAAPKLAFAFPGQGSLRLDGLARLVASDARFTNHLADLAKPASDLLSFDVLAFCRRPEANPDALKHDNARAQTVLFCVCMSLACRLRDMGIAPETVLGHSVGEWPAACVSGQVSVEDGLKAVFHRGRLMSTTGKGAALSVKASEAQLAPLLIEGVALACVNGANLCLLSGRPEDVQAMAKVLQEQKIRHAPVPIDVAVHSPLMDPAVAPFAEILAHLVFKAPSIPMLSSVTGAYFPADGAANRRYFAQQLRAQVRFDRTIETLASEPSLLVLEVGISSTITALLTAGFTDRKRHLAVPLLPVGEGADMDLAFERVPGLLWSHGRGEPGRANSVPLPAVAGLPGYPFQRKRCWVDLASASVSAPATGPADERQAGGPTIKQPAEHLQGTVHGRVLDLIASASGLPATTLESTRTFLELGFDSILLMQLESAIHTEFGLRVTWRQLLEDHPSPARLVDFVRGSLPDGDEGSMNHARPKPGALSALATPASPASPKACQDPSTSIHGLTVLREAGPRNIFFSYDGEGQILPYLKFARRMPPEFSLYAISPQRLPNIPQVHTTVEDMARHCVSILRKKQAQGPYLVGGLCAGGVIAFEMARQLEEAGDKVDWVVMFDTLNPQTPYRPFLVTRQRVKGLLRIKQGSRPMGAKPSQPESEATVMGARGSMRPPSGFGTISSLVGKARSLVHYEIEKKVKDASVATRIRLLRHLMQTDGEWPAAVTPLGELDIFSKVGLEYHPGTLNANLALVRAHLEIEGMDPPAIHYVKEPLLGWQGHTKGKLVVIDSAGGHTSMLLEEPWFEELADSLGKLL